jgi:hypothetical protein
MCRFPSGEQSELPASTQRFDVRPFRDLWGKTKHDGRHDDVVRQFVHHEGFPNLVADVKFTLKELLKDGEASLSLCFWCEHGKHRSVCAADLFGHVLRSVLDPEFFSIQVKHLTQELRMSHHWRTCKECSTPRLTYVPFAVTIWRDAFQFPV